MSDDINIENINEMLKDIEKAEKELKKLEVVEKVHRHEGESMEQCVSRGIATLINEGYEQDQASAIAYSMCGEGKSNCCEDCKKQ